MPLSTADKSLPSALAGLESAYLREVGAYVDRAAIPGFLRNLYGSMYEEITDSAFTKSYA